MATTIESDLLTRAEAAAYLKIKPQTLAAWVVTKRVDLPFVRIGARAVRYRRRDLDALIAKGTVGAN